MLKFPKMKKPLLVFAAIAAFGFSSFGVINTANAFKDSRISSPEDHINLIALENSSVNPDGTFCNPYGCSGCSGCTSLEYQQNIDKNSEIDMY